MSLLLSALEATGPERSPFYLGAALGQIVAGGHGRLRHGPPGGRWLLGPGGGHGGYAPALHLNLSKHPAGQVIVAILEAQRTLATQDKFLRQQRAG